MLSNDCIDKTKVILKKYRLPIFLLEDAQIISCLKLSWAWVEHDGYETAIRPLLQQIIDSQRTVYAYMDRFDLTNYKKIKRNAFNEFHDEGENYYDEIIGTCIDCIADRITLKNLMELLGSEETMNNLIVESSKEENKDKTLSQFLKIATDTPDKL